MDSWEENKGGWLVVLGVFVVTLLKTIGLIREKEIEDDGEEKVREEIEKRIHEQIVQEESGKVSKPKKGKKGESHVKKESKS